MCNLGLFHQHQERVAYMLTWTLKTRDLSLFNPCVVSEGEARELTRFFFDLDKATQKASGSELEVFVRYEHAFECFGPCKSHLNLHSAFEVEDVKKVLLFLARVSTRRRPMKSYIKRLVEEAGLQLKRHFSPLAPLWVRYNYAG